MMTSFAIPEGKVIKIEVGGKVLWEQFTEPDEPTEPVKTFNYVSLGDSIAAGHRIDKNWATDYGWGRQYRCSEKLVRPDVKELKAYIEEWKADEENAKDLELGNITLDETIREDIEDGKLKGYYCTYSWNTSTKIVPNSYTDKISKQLQGIYDESNVTTTSFAVSGSMIYRKHGDNRSLIEILDEDSVKEALSKADLVTISIGANSILEAGLNRLPSFLTEGGSLDDLEKTVEYNLRQLEKTAYTEVVSFSNIKAWDILVAHKSDGTTDNIYVDKIENNVLIVENLDTGKKWIEITESTYVKFDRQIYSYKRLFDKLTSINPNAKYVFTTIHNPMKYLYVAKGTEVNDYLDGFLGTWLNTIPQTTIVGVEVDKKIKQLILDTDIITKICNRINGDKSTGWEGISAWAERYIAGGGISKQDGKPFTSLNGVIRQSIEAYNNPNIVFTETHELFDTVPDRQGAGELHYNDLVNMQITRGYDADNLDWSKLWGDAPGSTPTEQIENYWETIIDKYTSGLTVDFDGLVAELEPIIVDRILSEAFDPHPRLDGHYVMYRSFADTLRENFPEEFADFPALKTITYNANGGIGTMETQKVLDKSVVDSSIKKIYSITNGNSFARTDHYHFAGWKSNDGNSYSDKQAIYVPNNTVLEAQWAIDTFTLTVVQGTPKDAVSFARLFSRDYDNRKLRIGDYSKYLNSDKSTWDNIQLSKTETFTVAYGQSVSMVVTGNVEKIISDGPKPNCSISQYNGSAYVVDNPDTQIGKLVTADFYMPDRNITIKYHFKFVPGYLYTHSYWSGYIGDKDLDVTYSKRDS